MQKALILGAALESQMKKFFVFFPLLAVSAPLAVSTLLFNPVTPVGAKPNHRPPNLVPGTVAPVPPNTPGYAVYRLTEKAGRELAKANEEAYQVQSLSRQASSTEATELVSLAQQTLSKAESTYRAGRYFEATEKAKAAKALYKAAETLYEGELGYKIGSRRPEGSTRRDFDAHKAQEKLAKAQAEMNYYRANDETVSRLINRARTLAGSSTPTQVSYDFSYLTRQRAAEHVAKAAIHLIAAQRGF